MERPPIPHPDASRPTLRMSFAQLRELVASSIDDDDPEEVAAEFEERATTYRPTRRARLTTLDDVIASLLRGA